MIGGGRFYGAVRMVVQAANAVSSISCTLLAGLGCGLFDCGLANAATDGGGRSLPGRLTLTIGFAVRFRHSCSVGFGVAAIAAHTRAQYTKLSQCRR